MRIEVGAGEKPAGGYDVHVDTLPLPHIEVVCRMDQLPFKDGGFSGLRANHVLEHQSYELVEATLREWVRVLAPGADVYIGVPDAFSIAGQWVRGEIDTREANHWILGGHSERDAHKGSDELGVPLWIWNAHHTLFDGGWLREHLEGCGLTDVDVVFDGVRNLCCSSRKPGGAPEGAGNG